MKVSIRLKVLVCAMFLLGVASVEASSFQNDNESGGSNTFLITASAASLCGVSSVTLTAEPLPSGTIIWFRDDRKYGTGQSLTLSSAQAVGKWRAIFQTDDCEVNNGVSNTIELSDVPIQPSSISGDSGVCANVTNLTYSVANVPGVTYTWNLPIGWVKTAGGNTNSIKVTAGTAGGTITVTPSNTCGNGTPISVSVTIIQVPVLSWKKEPSDTLYVGAQVGFSVTASQPVSTYAWGSTSLSASVTAIFPPAGDTATIKALTAGETEIRVQATNACGVSTILKKTVKILTPPTIRVDACISAMYDFQYQLLEVYCTSKINYSQWQWQWYAKKRGEADTEYKPISGATNPSYTIPAYTYDKGIVFRAGAQNIAASSTTLISDTLDMEFVATNGTDFVELKSPVSITGNSNTGGALQFLYLNLGAERDPDGTQNACDFGDLYQWGRVKDGHQNIVWTKDTSIASNNSAYRNIIFDAATVANQIDYDPSINYNNAPGAPNLEGGATTWQVVSGDPAESKFIVNAVRPHCWNPSQVNYYYWITAASQKTSNDPCPLGWRVPTQYEWAATFVGVPDNNDLHPSLATENTWAWRPNKGNRIAGAMIITFGTGSGLDSNKRIILPAAGNRQQHDGSLFNVGAIGKYWSCTTPGVSDPDNGAYNLTFYTSSSSILVATKGFTYRGIGEAVRCIKE